MVHPQKLIFDDWNQSKQLIDQQESYFFINPREIWYVKMGKNIGYEQDGKQNFLRPVLVIKKIGRLFFYVALTTRGKPTNFYHQLNSVEFDAKRAKHAGSSFCTLSQAKPLDKRRFVEKIGILGKIEFETVKQKLKTLLF